MKKNKDHGVHFLSLLQITKLPWALLIVTCLVSILQTVLNLLLPNISAQLLSGDFSDQALKTMVWVLTLNAFVLTLRQFFMEISKSKVTLSFRKAVLQKVLHLETRYFDEHPSGSLISRITLDTATLSDFIVGAFCYIPSLLYTLCGSFVIIFSYNWRLVVLEAILLPILFGITWLHGRLQFKWYNQIQTKLSVLSGFLAERLLNIPLMKLFVQEEFEERNGLNTVNELYGTQKKYMFRLMGVEFLVQFESVVQSIVVVGGGAVLIQQGHIDLQQWIAFYLYSGGLVGSVQQLLDYWQRYKQMTGSAKRITEIAAAKEEQSLGSAELPAQNQDIVLEDLSFAYSDGTLALNHISLTFPVNQKTAIVGRSGAGKTTLLYLLERFFEPSSGRILYGGTDISNYSYEDWRSSIGYVSQNAALFSGSIRDNVLYGIHRPVTDAELTAALEQAQILDFVRSSPDGLDTPVGENGSKLSGGQRQRVALARLFLSDPRIILLDEATSSLDAEARAAIHDCFDALAKDRTMIIVSHDLSDSDRADRIVVLDHGVLNAQGPRDEIQQNNPIYRALKNVQEQEVTAHV